MRQATSDETEDKLVHCNEDGSLTKETIIGIRLPEQYPPDLWGELAARGRLRKFEPGLSEIVEM